MRQPATTLWHKLRTLGGMPGLTLLWLLPMWVLIGVFAGLTAVVAPKRLTVIFGADMGNSPWVPLTSEAQFKRARALQLAIGMAAKYAPWRSDCYPQAFAASLALRISRVPHNVYFGLRRSEEDGALKAHAWVRAGRCAVAGGKSFGQFTVVRCFATAPPFAPAVQ